MTILKRGCLAVFALVICLMMLPALVSDVSAHGFEAVENDTTSVGTVYPEEVHYTGEELLARIREGYEGAKRVTGFRGFQGRCSTLVNGTIVAMGISTEYHSCDGRDVYNIYEDMSRTDCGYDVVCYSAQDYSLADALYAVSENGTKNVYNLVVGWQGGRTGASSAYGHTVFLQGIVDGNVYFCESFGLKLAGTYYSEGEPIVCTIAEFAEYFNKWAYFEGIVHFDYPDVVAPRLAEMETSLVSHRGFTLQFQASDNVGIEEIYARVWRYGQTEEEAVTVPVTMLDGKCWVRVDTADFENFNGRYYVNCYARDAKGNESVIGMAEEGVTLYQADPAAGVYRVKRDNTGIHNAPYVRVNNTNTRESVVNRGVDVSVSGSIINDNGELWYQLSGGGWVDGDALRQLYTWSEVWDFIQEFLASMLSA